MIEISAYMFVGFCTYLLIGFILFGKAKAIIDWVLLVATFTFCYLWFYDRVENTIKLEQQQTVSIAFLQKRMEHLDRELVHLYKMDMELKKVDLDADMYISQAMKIRTRTLNKIDNKTYKVELLRKDIEWARQWLPSFMIGEENEL